MLCPYCKGDIPDDAVKCMHCGEWVKQKPAAASEKDWSERPATPVPSGLLGRVWRGGLTQGDVVEGVRWYVKYRIVMAIVGLVVFLIFLFAVFIPQANKINDNNTPFGPSGITCDKDFVTGPDGVPSCPP